MSLEKMLPTPFFPHPPPHFNPLPPASFPAGKSDRPSPEGRCESFSRQLPRRLKSIHGPAHYASRKL